MMVLLIGFSTTILGHNFSAPFFISPCARAGNAHPDAELNFVKGAAEGDILYMVSSYLSGPHVELLTLYSPPSTPPAPLRRLPLPRPRVRSSSSSSTSPPTTPRPRSSLTDPRRPVLMPSSSPSTLLPTATDTVLPASVLALRKLYP